MKMNVSEISSVLKSEIEGYGKDLEVAEIGHVLEVGDGIARVYGLSNAMSSEMVEFENGVMGQVFNLEEDSVSVILLGGSREIREGMSVKTTKQLLSVPVGEGLIGRVVDPLGNPIDGKGPIEREAMRPIEVLAPGIAYRQSVNTPLQTGIKAIDAMIPIGRGQRELIIGDRKTGKTAIAIDAIINQKGTGVLCFYVAIGQKESTVASVVATLEAHGAMAWTTVISTSASDPAPLQYIAPYAGCTMAEHFMYEHKKETLVVYDDLTKQAQAYRQLSLLVRRPPGREAYPGDVFYCHSRLLERAAKLSDEMGGGSMTALPIIETQEGEVSAYIPTNVISITDGQIYLVPDLFFAGVRPAVDVGISVSRVGGAAQIKGMKKIAGMLRLDLAQFRDLEAFAQLGTELDKATQAQLDRGARMVELLKQPQYVPMDVVDQVLSIFIGTQGYLDDVPLNHVAPFEKRFLAFINDEYSEIRQCIKDEGALSEEMEKLLREQTALFKIEFTKDMAG